MALVEGGELIEGEVVVGKLEVRAKDITGDNVKKKPTRWLLPTLFAVLLSLILVTPVLAIADPDSMTVNSVYVYRNVRETGDQLYLIDYTIDYTVNPDENITEAFLCRLMNGSTELRAVAPYAYYDDGYDRGVIAIYFNAADAPTWEGSYSMYVVGNPILSWSGDPPSVYISTFNLWQDNSIATQNTVVSSRVLYLADILELEWSVDMIEASGGGHSLTSYGEDYFTNVIPYADDIAPYAFAGQIIQPEVEDVDDSTAYADVLVTNIQNTPLDLTDMANAWGVARGPLTALLYYGVVAFALIMITKKMQSQKPLMILAIPAVVMGAFVGVPLLVTVLVGFLAFGYIAFSIFYKGSTA